MIYDILITLMTPMSGPLPIEVFVTSEKGAKFLHSAERKILEEIIKIAKQYQDIVQFINVNGLSLKTIKLTDSMEDPLQKGLYLQAFTEGVDRILNDKYIPKIIKLEKEYLKTPTQSLLFIFHQVDIFQPLFTFLQSLIDGIKTQKLHGCALLQYLHENMMHGNKDICEAMQIIFKSVNMVFLKQLTHWILYGKVVDTYSEFFIQSFEFSNSTSLENEKGVTSNTAGTSCASSGKTTGMVTSTITTDTSNLYAEVWRYEICCEYLPYYLSYSWAEKVLFIGQTVLMFKVGMTNKINKKHIDWNYENINNESKGNNYLSHYNKDLLWNNQEPKYFKMIETLINNEDIIVTQYENIIDEIKLYVTERLSQIAVKQADLIKQLKLIKDFYLLGRGELFLEFIKITYKMEKQLSIVTENTLRDLIKAFDSAAISVNITDDLDLFTLTLCKSKAHTFDIESFSCFQYLCLQYKIEWPLHLLFSPKVIDRYNELFRFLLLIKKMQYELHMIWALNRKNKDEGRIKLMHLLHQMMFFIDNLQYYIQVDVLESQFSILMNTVNTSNDFEQIEKAHNVFHANILSLCFLLSNNDQSNIQTSLIQCSDNPVLTILNKIFQLCEKFCSFVNSCHPRLTKDEIEKNNLLEQNLQELIADLMNLLVGLREAPNSTPLSQLLLRLDFNYWFSKSEVEED